MTVAPPSGRFVLRLSPELHGTLRREADRRGLSLNAHCVELLQSPGAGDKDRDRVRQALRPVLTRLKRAFGKDLLGCLLFGSRARGEASEASDVDLLVVLDDATALKRSLYRLWDDQIAQGPLEVNPHFVHLPDGPRTAGSLWLESAVDGVLIWDTKGKIARTLSEIHAAIEDGTVRRYWSHGHPFWRRGNHEEQVPGT